MYHHVKEWMYTVHVDTPHPRFGNVLVEQFGGPNGELAAALQYAVQGLNNSMGVSSTADYLKISGQLEVDLPNDIAAEARAKITYERLLQFCEDPGSKDALDVPEDARDRALEVVHANTREPGQGCIGDWPASTRSEVRQQVL